jgi:hypothetical protein
MGGDRVEVDGRGLLLPVQHLASSSFPPTAMFAWLISHQPAVLFSQNKPTTSNQPAIRFSQNKPAPTISQQYVYLKTNQHQPSATSQRNRLHQPKKFNFVHLAVG